MILQSSPTFRKLAIQNQEKPRSSTHLNTIRVKWGEEDELVLSIGACIADDVIQRDPAQNCKWKPLNIIAIICLCGGIFKSNIANEILGHPNLVIICLLVV